MRFEKIATTKTKPRRYHGPCPQCGGKNITYLHDLHCPVCDNTTVIWCADCDEHYKVIE